METCFNIKYNFDRNSVLDSIDNAIRFNRSDYICVVDDKVLRHSTRDAAYLHTINSGMLAVCDCTYALMIINALRGTDYGCYPAAHLMGDLCGDEKYTMTFVGYDRRTLDCVRNELGYANRSIRKMPIHDVHFRSLDNFDFKALADKINAQAPDIVWVGLDMTDQEYFIQRLSRHLNRGIVIGIGSATFEHLGGEDFNDAPDWMINTHTDFAYHMLKAPARALSLMANIAAFMPRVLRMTFKKHRYERCLVAQMA